MTLFSERNGYVKPSDSIIRESMPLSIQNAICSCFDDLEDILIEKYTEYNGKLTNLYRELDIHLWMCALNERKAKYDVGRESSVAIAFLQDDENSWFKKLDLVETVVKYLFDQREQDILNDFINRLNDHFDRLNFAYRIIDKQIVEITSENEIKSVEDALQNSTNNIRMHLSKALELYSRRPDGDYSNSIKESISAVEACCRARTGNNTLGQALSSLKQNGITIPNVLKEAFEKLYAYTNQGETGIRHSLMDEAGTYVPSGAEALFMLVSCSAFINYLNKKSQ